MAVILTPQAIDTLVRAALAEDVGTGDITAPLIPLNVSAQGQIICRQVAVICGTALVDGVYGQLDSAVQVDWQVQDGESVKSNQVLCTLHGPARSLVVGERCALNFLQCLSGVATVTQRYGEQLAGTAAQLFDTRKTLPGLRLAQKYAVHCGGGQNHRCGLYDAILIKDNHITACGSITAAITQARQQQPGMPIEIEVENHAQIEEALACQVEMILLDNFSLSALCEAVAMVKGRAILEASGNVTLESIRNIAMTGVDRISAGSLTKNIEAIDLTMQFQ